ncbi:MAG: tetratricopeptide repeat protein [Candidatus Schekmanbacteria bacterium]|nr:tetratricopeptide repeat protein [Candidatus Schekmanbacteria bacterium]
MCSYGSERAKTLVIVFACSIFLSAASGCAGRAKVEREARARVHRATGEALISKGQLDAALAEFELARRDTPDDYAIYFGRGISLQGLGRMQEAITSYQKSLELNPKQPLVYNSLAAAYLKIGQWEDVLVNAKLALEDTEFEYPSAAQYNMGMAHLGRGDLDSAEQAFKLALETFPKFDRAHFQLGMLQERRGTAEVAAKHFEEAIKANKGYVEAYYHLGVAYMKLGVKDLAHMSFRRVTELIPAGTPAEPGQLRADAAKMLAVLEK